MLVVCEYLIKFSLSCWVVAALLLAIKRVLVNAVSLLRPAPLHRVRCIVMICCYPAFISVITISRGIWYHCYELMHCWSTPWLKKKQLHCDAARKQVVSCLVMFFVNCSTSVLFAFCCYIYHLCRCWWLLWGGNNLNDVSWVGCLKVISSPVWARCGCMPVSCCK